MKHTLYNFDTFVINIQKLICVARANCIEVIYIRHDDGVGSTLTKGSIGYEIFEQFQPQAGEQIFDKTVNSAFKESGLLPYLQSKNEQDIMIVGLQSDYCINANVIAGFEHGYKMYVPSDTNTTYNNAFMSAAQSVHYYNDFLWNNRYAKCITMTEALKKLHQAVK